MASGITRRRRDQLLQQLEEAEREWGSRKEDMLNREASFFRKILDVRVGSGASTRSIQTSLADLAVDRTDDFLSGGTP